MTSLTLFEIAKEYRHITDVLMDSGVDEQTLTDTLEAESWDLELKAQNYGFVIRNLEATAASIKEAEAAMAARRKALEKRAMHLQERLKTGMEIAGVSELSCPYFSIKIKKNPPAIDIWDEKQIPQKYLVQAPPPPPSIDKKAIKADIDAGVDVPGAMKVQGTRIEIK
jgi:hypothetical protein